jgi:hypothetical protein
MKRALAAACSAAVAGALLTSVTLAQEAAPQPAATEPAPPPAGGAVAAPVLDAQAQLGELKQAIAVRDQVIRNLIRRLEQLERSVNELAVASAPVAPAGGEPRVAPDPVASSPDDATAAAPEPVAAPPDDQQLIRAAFERTLIERGGLLLGAGTFELEPSVSYAHSSSENLVIDGFTIFPVLIVGDVFSERRRRNTLTTAVTARFGLPWKSQLEVRLPWIQENASRLTGDGEEVKVTDHGIGDLELAWSRDLPRLFGRGPQLLGALRWKLATARDPFEIDDEQIPFGIGFETLSASLTGVTVLDPVVLFGTLTYTEVLGSDKGDNHINPGDSLDLQLGMALALNLETSLSLAADVSSTDRTRLNGTDVPGTYVNTGTFSIGMSRAFPSGRSFDTSLAIGLSEDSPDLQLGFSMPFRR